MDERIRIIELDFVNAFLAEAEGGFVLIDTGMGRHWDRLEAELRSLGCLPGKLKLVLITHGDHDHTGNCAKLQTKYKIPIAMHVGDAYMAATGVIPQRKARTMRGRVWAWLARLRMGKIACDRFKPDILLSDGQDLYGAYGFQAKIVHLPGHTKGSIGILTEEGDLFVGDTLVNRSRPETAMYIEDSGELRSSIGKLKRLPIKTVYPGHGKPFLMEQLAVPR
jgi:glyoxylase-like metal-dependent hydrolase (beta-lactamase superfamily II)